MCRIAHWRKRGTFVLLQPKPSCRNVKPGKTREVRMMTGFRTGSESTTCFGIQSCAWAFLKGKGDSYFAETRHKGEGCSGMHAGQLSRPRAATFGRLAMREAPPHILRILLSGRPCGEAGELAGPTRRSRAVHSESPRAGGRKWWRGFRGKCSAPGRRCARPLRTISYSNS